jgi:Zinc knuckle
VDDLVRAKIEDLKCRATSTSPICFKCGEKGHFANTYRNGTQCFACNDIGHRSFHCPGRQHLKAKTQPPSSLIFQSNPPSRSEEVASSRSRSRPQSPMKVGKGVTRFFASEANAHLEATFENSIVVNDTAGLGKIHIEAALKHQMPKFHWVARYYDDHRYLVEAPNPRWLQTMTSRGSLRLENVDLPTQRWDPALDEGVKLRPTWILVRGCEAFCVIWTSLGA